MALPANSVADRASDQPAPVFVERIRQSIRERDPDASFSAVYPAPDPGIWVMEAHVSPVLTADIEFREALAAQAVDLMVEHGVHVATLLLDRVAAP